MIKVTVIDRGGSEEIDTYPNLETAIHEMHMMWMETTGFECYLFQNDQGDIVATMLRHFRDPELCITAYNSGHMDIHRCQYVLDGDGQYDYTEIALIDTCPRRLGNYNPPTGS
jgi:hypothetical protein